jgi:dihydroorotate dehydrogenase electron transfer subunit
LTFNKIYTIKIQKIEEECKGIKSFTFNTSNLVKSYVEPLPGQFIMVWVPGIDEVPMSLSDTDSEGNWTITVKNVGECTNALHNLNVGDYIGIRGPLGNSFTIPQDSSLLIFLVGGGIGMAPLKYLAKQLHKNKINFTLIEGANQDKEIMYFNEFQTFSKILYCTDDGSFGSEGFASKIFKEELNKYSQKQLSHALTFTCGPEKMMFEVFKVCEEYGIRLEASLERMMRCGCGLCGLCALDPLGLLVCKDGPVFDSKVLRNLQDFGKYKRDFSGRKIKI